MGEVTNLKDKVEAKVQQAEADVKAKEAQAEAWVKAHKAILIGFVALVLLVVAMIASR